MAKIDYLIALGSNQRHHRHGHPNEVIKAAFRWLDQDALSLCCVSNIMTSRPIGPSNRSYANAVTIVESELYPGDLITHLKGIERQFGSRTGQRWSKRTLDLDIILSTTGIFQSKTPNLCIPHYAMRQRDFVLSPAAEIAADWRDPITNLSIQHLLCRLKRAKPLDPKQKHY